MKTVCLLILTTVVLMATDQSNQDLPQDSPMKPIAYLVGGTWFAQGEIPGVGSYTAERTYRWALGGKFIEQRHVMRFHNGETETTGIIGWDPEKKAIMAWGFGDGGGIATSRAEQVTETESRFEGVRVGGFISRPTRATNKKVNNNEFVETAETKKGNDWTPLFAFKFTRKKSLTPPAPMPPRT